MVFVSFVVMVVAMMVAIFGVGAAVSQELRGIYAELKAIRVELQKPKIQVVTNQFDDPEFGQ